MSPSPHGAQRSDPSLQRRIEDALRTIKVYKTNLFDLDDLFRDNRDARIGQDDFSDNIEKTMTQTLDTLDRAKEFVDKQKEKTTSRWWKKNTISKEWKDYEQLQRVMEENNGKVQYHFRQMQNMVENKKPPSFDLFSPRIRNTVPFTEPYDEGLCEFPTMNSRA